MKKIKYLLIVFIFTISLSSCISNETYETYEGPKHIHKGTNQYITEDNSNNIDNKVYKKRIFTCTSCGFIIEYVDNPDGGVCRKEIQNEYDETNNETKVIESVFTSSEHLDNRTTIIKKDKEEEREILYYDYGSSQKVIKNVHYKTMYDDLGNIKIRYCTEEDINSKRTSYYTNEYEYNSNGNVIKNLTTYYYSSFSDIMGSELREYTYDEFNRIIKEIYINKYFNEIESVTEYKYNEDGTLCEKNITDKYSEYSHNKKDVYIIKYHTSGRILSKRAIKYTDELERSDIEYIYFLGGDIKLKKERYPYEEIITDYTIYDDVFCTITKTRYSYETKCIEVFEYDKSNCLLNYMNTYDDGLGSISKHTIEIDGAKEITKYYYPNSDILSMKIIKESYSKTGLYRLKIEYYDKTGKLTETYKYK